nr:hypothetical protein [Tanacetum cinerariifolium]
VNTPRNDEDRLKLMELMVFLPQKGVCVEIGIVATPTVVAAYTKRRKRVIIIDPKEELSLKTLAETPKDDAMDHVNKKSKNPQYIKRYQGMKKRPQTESEARKNMMIYLKNTAGYKMDFFKGMTKGQKEVDSIIPGRSIEVIPGSNPQRGCN